jgi:hypothetical protein
MKLLEGLSNLVLEKYIGTIETNIDINIEFTIKKTNHATDRFTRDNIEGYNQTEISNEEIVEFLSRAKRQMAKLIASQKIVNGTKFVVKSPELEMACPIIAKQKNSFKWEMLVLTVFRESFDNPFRVGKGQIVISV